ncbi:MULTISPECIES: hypothetical protein [Enterobacterales]|uniref:Uncharacterized protein n=2 Tax=Enterobacteriaceae TaxID=543 RepID=A0ABT2DX10_9ENTR|nr:MULTISPECIES: hypothetical protein [Enterobacteriaceae]MEB4673568.1 hypothetical protein [Enterobacteriaceae bacterium G50]MCS2149334.1 hypothetical protein [Scandinavium manionii]MCS2152037.1 hypothetical protein [Scandinavium goeteborgense]MCS2156535.1 hypothetical protein [Scandinavium hiltneri]MCS2160159.1 hypothetical protein [Scandinavium hiltneri]
MSHIILAMFSTTQENK